jgi:hypothetical protein
MLHLNDLDDDTRQLMLEELLDDLTNERQYLSSRLNDRGRAEYSALLREAISSGDDASLARALEHGQCMAPFENRRRPSGGYASVRVPVTAAATLAEGEFNRFYIRALCRRALEVGVAQVEVYRAKAVSQARPQSEALLGKPIDAAVLLDDLRRNIGVDTALGVPAGPGSGLSVRLRKGEDARRPGLVSS